MALSAALQLPGALAGQEPHRSEPSVGLPAVHCLAALSAHRRLMGTHGRDGRCAEHAHGPRTARTAAAWAPHSTRRLARFDRPHCEGYATALLSVRTAER